MRYLDFEKEEKGFKELTLNIAEFKKNIGKKICFVNKRRICKHRGWYDISYGTIAGTYYNTIYLNDYNDSIDLRDIAEAGIKIEN